MCNIICNNGVITISLEGSLEGHDKEVDEARDARGDELTTKPIIQQKGNATSQIILWFT